MARKGKNKLSVDFKGFKEMYEDLDRLNADTKKITTEALEKSFEAVTPDIQAAIAPHKDSGDTEKSLVKTPKVKWEGMRASVEVGFNIENGGLPSVFLMYGTPRHFGGNQYGKHGTKITGIPADNKLYNAVYGASAKHKARNAQKEVFEKALREAME